ncbi:EAL domain-containing protein [Oceanibacterium hippocampi]|nr:EAL domain-containing protein [Oceanibacterium hippocampi]
MFAHLLCILAYGVVAVALAVGLPDYVPALEPVMAYGAGALAFLLFALLHGALARRAERNALYGELDELRVNLSEAEFRLERQSELLDSLAGDIASQEALGKELVLIRNLLGQLGRNTAQTAPQADPTPAGPAARGQHPENDETDDDEAEVAGPPAPKVDPELSESDVLNIVRWALKENRVDLYLQPVVSLPQRKIHYYEAFSRIRGPRGQIIEPGQYLKLAADAGLLPTIDNLLLFRCVQLVRRIRRGRNREQGPSFFVNISSHALADEQFFPQFTEFLELHRDLAHSMIFELSQADLIANQETVGPHLRRLFELGFAFSIDHVTRLDFDYKALAERGFQYMKIDAGALLGEADGVRSDIQMADVQQALARAGIQLIAGKVEHEDTVIGLLDVDIAFGQGYLFGRPKRSQDDIDEGRAAAAG